MMSVRLLMGKFRIIRGYYRRKIKERKSRLYVVKSFNRMMEETAV